MFLTNVRFVVCFLVLASVVGQGSSQTSNCYVHQFFGCPVGSRVDTAPTSDECCNRGRLTFALVGSEVCMSCTENGICYPEEDSSCSTPFPALGAQSIHDCCLRQPGGAYYSNNLGVCNPCSTQTFQCFPQTTCEGNNIPDLSGPPTKSSIQDCCGGPGFAYSFKDQCIPCVVLGWFQESFEGVETGLAYSLTAGYIKGSGPRVMTNVEAVGGTATQETDYVLRTESVQLVSTANRTVLVTFRVDNVAHESVETLTLRLVPTNPPSGAILRDEIMLSIIDGDELEIQFTEDDYRSNEAEGSVTVRIGKERRIANPLTLLVEPFTVEGAIAAGRPLPVVVPADDNPFSPNRARSSPEDRRDFTDTPITVTFEADETAEQVVNSLPVSIPIRNDEIDEADDEVFVAVLSVLNATAVGNINIDSRPATLLVIRDDDDVMIGFQREEYRFTEPEIEVGIVDVVLLEKENGQLTEQTYLVAVDVTSATPNTQIRPATPDEDYVSNTSIVLRFEPDQQTIDFPFDLLPDNLPEGLEGFSVRSSSEGAPAPPFAPPVSLFSMAFIVIEDNDRVEVGFETDYVVTEDVGLFEVCVRVLNVDDADPLLLTVPLLVETVVGTAGEADYAAISGDDVPIFLEDEARRNCFMVQILEDNLFEQNETFTLRLSLDPAGVNLSSSVVISRMTSEVTILANDDMCPDLDPLVNGVISYSPDMTGPFRDVGTVATHRCDAGFVLVGAEMRICQNGGMWTGDPPSCQPIQCPNLDSPGNGMVSFDGDQDPDFNLGTVATYECDSGFVLVGDENRTCTAGDGTSVVGTWTGEAPSCQALCPDLDPLVNGDISYSPDMTGPFRDVGTVATHRCEEGFVLVGVVTRGCIEGGNWSDGPPSCQREPECPDLPPLSNGMIVYSPDITPPTRMVGTEARHVCNSGFILVGNEIRVCQEDTTFSGQPPVCQPIQCPSLAPPENGMVSVDGDQDPGFDLGTVATYECDSGFVLVGDENRTCTAGDGTSVVGTWTGQAPTCEPLCPDLDPLVNGDITYSPDMTGPFRDVGTVATHSCSEGFVLVGAETRECLEGGNWSGQPPSCRPLCPDLDPLVNGDITYSPDMTGPFRDVGTVATHSCSEGFVLVGAETRECLEGGNWSGQPPSCQREPECPDLPPLSNGMIVYSPDSTPPTRMVGTEARHVCNSGFILVGNEIRVCQADTTFSGEPPVCRDTGIVRVNDTAAGDPVMTVPLYLTNTSMFPELGDDQIINLCFEVHGEDDRNFNLVSDSCVTVNAHYTQPVQELGYNVINVIAVRAVGLDGICRNISVSAATCQATIDNTVLDSPYSSQGIAVRMYRDRVRIAVPNCQDLDLVMWVFCEEGSFTGDPDFGEPDETITTPMIRFVIARGLNLRESAHGILGQFWNVPIEVEQYTGSLMDGTMRDDTYVVTVRYPRQEPRQFLSLLDTPLWDVRRKEYCLYAGNRQGGPIAELESPNDPVIEGFYTDYEITETFGYEFPYSHFEPSECN